MNLKHLVFSNTNEKGRHIIPQDLAGEDSDAPIAAAIISLLHKFQSAVCIAANPMALKAYVSLYLKSANSLVESALKKGGDGESDSREVPVAKVKVALMLACLLLMAGYGGCFDDCVTDMYNFDIECVCKCSCIIFI